MERGVPILNFQANAGEGGGNSTTDFRISTLFSDFWNYRRANEGKAVVGGVGGRGWVCRGPAARSNDLKARAQEWDCSSIRVLIHQKKTSVSSLSTFDQMPHHF